MKRTMIYLPENTHEGLRKLAFENKTSVADLIRKAVDTIYGEDIEDIRDMEEAIEEYKANPESFISLEELRRQKRVNV